jgi:hypothetical protein
MLPCVIGNESRRTPAPFGEDYDRLTEYRAVYLVGRQPSDEPGLLTPWRERRGSPEDRGRRSDDHSTVG